MDNNVSRMLEMQRKIKEAQQQSMVKNIDVVQIEEPQPTKEEKEEAQLPTKYVGLNELRVSSKELAKTTSYLDKMRNINDQYDNIKMNEQQAKKVKRELMRLTTGVASVVPLQCKGSQCSFSSTCVVGDTVVLGKKDVKIKDLKINDIIYSYNIATKRIEKDIVTDHRYMGNKKVFQITTWYGNKITLTSDHQVLTVNKSGTKFKWKTIDEGLTKNDQIVISDSDDIDDDLEAIGDGFIDRIISIKEKGFEDVYDITVKKNSNFIGNNIVVHNCTFYQEKVEDIVGKPCPTEAHLLDYWMEKYKTEFNVDDNSLTDLHAIGRLCTFDIYEMRLTRYLSENDQTLLVDFISSYDEPGRAISNKATSAAWDTIDKINRMRSKELKELMATREARAKAIQTISNVNQSNTNSALKKKIEDLIKTVNNETSNTIIEGEVKDIN